MELIIGENRFSINTFIESPETTRIVYTIPMDMADTNINVITSASEFDIENGEIVTHYGNVECDNYTVSKKDGIITYKFFKEIGKRVDELAERLSSLETSQQEQDDIIIELLSLS